MAQLSDTVLLAALVTYVAAMVAYLVEFAFGTRGAVARVAARPARQLVTVGGGPAPAAEPPAPPAPAGDATLDAPAPGRTRVAGIIGAALTVAALGLHLTGLVARGIAAGRVPWGNMYEFVILLTGVFALGWLVLLAIRPSLRPLGVFVAAAQVLLLGFAGLVLASPVEPLQVALESVWLKIHVSAAATASGLFLLGFIPAALFLVRAGHDAGKQRFPYTLGGRLPAAETLDRLTFRLHAFAFVIWTLAILCGAIWAEAAWGRYWGWDPKETWSFVSWVGYVGYLHARLTPSVKRTTTTWFAVAAWVTMLINLYVINFVAVGLHSYA